MSFYVVLTAEQFRLEREADALLNRLDSDPDRPVYSERQLRRKGGRLRVATERLAKLSTIRGQPLRDELYFLAAISDLTPLQRACVHKWSDGWTQTEIAARIGTSQQSVAAILRRALRICYDSTPLSFEQFSRRSIYRPPSHEWSRYEPLPVPSTTRGRGNRAASRNGDAAR